MTNDEELSFNIEWNKELKIFVAVCLQFPNLIGEGETEEEAFEDLSDLIDEELDAEVEEGEAEQRIERSNIMIKKTDKKIGVVGWKLGDSSYGVTQDYIDFANRFGRFRVVTSDTDPSEIDMLILPGGADAQSSNYGQAPSIHSSNPDVHKEYFFKERLKDFIGQMPIYGICLGAQYLNIFFGGSLCQHLIYHDQSPGRWRAGHRVYRVDEPRTDKTGFEVNSHHHQAVVSNSIAPDLEPLLVCSNYDSHLTGDGDIIEAFRHKELPIIGVQFHSEQWLSRFCIEAMNSLLTSIED